MQSSAGTPAPACWSEPLAQRKVSRACPATSSPNTTTKRRARCFTSRVHKRSAMHLSGAKQLDDRSGLLRLVIDDRDRSVAGRGQLLARVDAQDLADGRIEVDHGHGAVLDDCALRVG